MADEARQPKRARTAAAGQQQPPPAAVPRREYSGLAPKTFWTKFVSQRRPLVLTGGLEDPELAAIKAWTLDGLTARAGDAMVAVEKREGSGEAFGKGRRVRMRFADFAAALRAGDQSLYLTTQEATEEEGEPEPLAAPPVAQLLADVPLPPRLMGQLVPQSVNLWLGSSAEGASSGLHHDYHDNLYLLLRGTKAFQLWPPTLAPRMHTHGQIAKVHATGRIVYQGQGDVRADGSLPGSQAQPGSQTRAATAAAGTDSDDASGSDEEAALQAALDRFNDGGCDSDDYAGSEAGEEGEPPSFSRVDLTRPAAEIAAQFPDFPGQAAATTCTLQAGDALYLPAGWFHDVTSSNAGAATEAGEAYHMALNLWFHPPDNLDPLAGFRRPYTSDHWPAAWAARGACKQ